jgi:peptidoglycan/LPS O-acetylase OafA/YrhL
VIVIIGHSHNLLAWHDGLMNTTIGLWTGVDVFLGISGFVITKSFRSQLRIAAEQGRWLAESANFLVRRAFRLLPASLFWILMVCMASWLFNRSGAFGSPAQDLQDAIAILSSISNIYFAMCTVGTIANCGPNGIYWTVSLEQQFYLLFPAIVLLQRRFLIGLGFAIVVFFAFVHRDVWVWYNRVDTIAVGILIGLLSETSACKRLEPTFLRNWGLNWYAAGSLLGFLLFGTAAMRYYLDLFVAVPAIVTVIVGALVFLASFNQGYLFSPGAVTDAIAHVGMRSYSVYLIHNFAMFATTETFFRLSPSGSALGPAYDIPMVATATVYLAIFVHFSYRLEVHFRGKAFRVRHAVPLPVAR